MVAPVALYPSVTTVPPVWALFDRVTVHDADPATLIVAGEQVSPDNVAPPWVMVTVAPMALIVLPVPSGLLAEGAPTLRLEEVLMVLPAIVRTAFATTPSGIPFRFKPDTRQTYRPA